MDDPLPAVIPRQPVEHPGALGFVCPDYFITHPRTGAKLERSDTLGAAVRVNGVSIGEFVAGLYEQAIADKLAPPARCATCAFRRGTEANHSVMAVGDALECVQTGQDFFCHHGGSPFETSSCGLCQGFVAVRDSKVGVWLRDTPARTRPEAAKEKEAAQ